MYLVYMDLHSILNLQLATGSVYLCVITLKSTINLYTKIALYTNV